MTIHTTANTDQLGEAAVMGLLISAGIIAHRISRSHKEIEHEQNEISIVEKADAAAHNVTCAQDLQRKHQLEAQ